ncbi:hypothetical protein TNCV_1804951 [Trichonephila clavipes]|nr:hypothetical protein TNCV_1804951 [Trichonephila clavipes]
MSETGRVRPSTGQPGMEFLRRPMPTLVCRVIEERRNYRAKVTRIKRFHVGQNLKLDMSHKKPEKTDWKRMVKKFYGEIEEFDKNSIEHFHFSSYGHFTQVVWATTWRIGCGKAMYMKNNRYSVFLVCNYGPAFVEWAQNEIAVVPDFHKQILLSDEAHFWLNGYVNKQNCRIWSEANPQVYVETPLHPEKLTVWCALWAGGILLQKR